MIHRLNVFLLSLIIAFAPVYLISTAYAATPKWVLEFIKAEKQINEKKRLKAQLVKQINESGTKKTITAVVETKPTATKVGSSMFKRVSHYAKNPGMQMVGVIAVTELLEAIGWVMEEGTYVKKEIVHEGDDCFTNPSTSSRTKSQVMLKVGERIVYQCYENADNTGWFNNVWPDNSGEAKEINHPLTPPILGAAMLGDGYNDPVEPEKYNDIVNTDNWTGVEDAYKEDPSGIGNELNDSLEDKAERAKPTPDNKPAPIGSPDYDNEPVNDDDNDRKWDEDGNEGKTENTEKTDPETGEKTTEGSFTLPKFCDWAFTVCEWYEDWQESDKKLQDHLDETASHQSQEKSFWQSVKDWFDWTKEEPELTDETLEIEQHEVIPYVRENHVSFNAGCPFSPETAVIELGILGNLEFQKDLTFICTFGDQARPYIQGLGYLGGLVYLLVGIRNGNG